MIGSKYTMDFTIVTVAHSIDLPLLKLQARSLDRYLTRDFVREIIVVDNSQGSASLDRSTLLPQYGDLPVRIIDASVIAPMPKASGWFTQQVYKLLISRHIWSKYYLMLDAKNHLVAPLTLPMLQAPDGRLCIRQYDYLKHPLKRYLLRCCDYFGIDQQVVNNFLPTVTPFTARTYWVRKLVTHIERNGQPFMQTFLAAKVTEFFLFGTYLLHLGHKLEDHYEFTPWINDGVWREHTDWISDGVWKNHTNEVMQQKITELPPRCFFGIHRAAFKNMDETTLNMVASFWYGRKLFDSYRDALRFARGCAMTYQS
jgi:hypothetical protein